MSLPTPVQPHLQRHTNISASIKIPDYIPLATSTIHFGRSSEMEVQLDSKM
jgi:hypothetical protein